MECTDPVTLLKSEDRQDRRRLRLRSGKSGRFRVFKRARRWCWPPAASAGRLQITSNSWEYTGDGHSLAYHAAGAELVDMEFVQFHPTGMVWPAGVRGHPGHGGCSRRGRHACCNNEGRRFMFDDIPEPYRKRRPPTTKKRAGATLRGTGSARRPPELLTRDHVARCIVREIKEGRGSPHGGVFLDISWIKDEACRTRLSTSNGNSPPCTISFRQLADIDITKQPMEVGPTTHYVMGGVRVDGDTQMSSVPGLFAAGECAAGVHGANQAWAATPCPICWCSANGPVSTPRSSPSRTNGSRTHDDQLRGRCSMRRWSRSSAKAARMPTTRIVFRADLQEMMQQRVGIVRHRSGHGQLRWTGSIACISGRARCTWSVTVSTTPLGTPPWIFDPCSPSPKPSLAPPSSDARAAVLIFARTFPEKDEGLGKSRMVIRKGDDGAMRVERTAIPELPAELKQYHRRDEMMPTATFRILAG